jgi:hypothetical protein
MSWVITPGWIPADADAAAYISAVEAADGQALENGVKVAIDNFVLGCKADGIWTAIKASCILAGARTLSGALVPLTGTAPTNFNFASADYNRKTGLVGNGTSKYLSSNRANNADPQNSKHIYVHQLSANTFTTARVAIGTSTGSTDSRLTINAATRNGSINAAATTYSTFAYVAGGWGMNRQSASSVSQFYDKTVTVISSTSTTPSPTVIAVFASGLGTSFWDGRLAFYSIGESLDLAKLDTRVTTLVNAFAAAIP